MVVNNAACVACIHTYSTRITIYLKTYFDIMLRILIIISRWPIALYTLAIARTYMCLY